MQVYVKRQQVHIHIIVVILITQDISEKFIFSPLSLYSVNYKFTIMLLIACLSATATVSAGVGIKAGVVFGEKSPFDSGYNHGQEDCNDFQNDVPIDEIYYFKPGYGPDYHTTNFNDGFVDGWTDEGCSIQELYDTLHDEPIESGNNYQGDNNDVNAYRESFNDNKIIEQPQSQSANTNQYAGCPSQIINGDCHIGQQQKTNNDFAQANRGEMD